MRFGFVTCEDLSKFSPSKEDPLLTLDDRAAVEVLRNQGHEVKAVVWGTPITASFEALVVRSPWDYSKSVATSRAFIDWLDQLEKDGVTLLNGARLIKWNLDKHYLEDLERAGVPIVPTVFLDPHQADRDEERITDALQEWGKPLVLKPAISAAARDTFLIGSLADLSQDLIAPNGHMGGDWFSFRAGRSFMLQPFLKEIQETGEWSCVFFDQAYSHSVVKVPGAGKWFVQDEHGGCSTTAHPPADVLEIANITRRLLSQGAALGGVPESQRHPLYTRIDIIPTARGPLVGEVELVEPELFFLSRFPDGPRPDLQAIELFIECLVGRLAS